MFTWVSGAVRFHADVGCLDGDEAEGLDSQVPALDREEVKGLVRRQEAVLSAFRLVVRNLRSFEKL